MDALTVERVTKLSRILCISVENQIPLAAKETVLGIGDVARDLTHPSVVRVRCDAGDVHRPGCDVDESSRRGPLLVRAPLGTGRASWPRIRLEPGKALLSRSRPSVIAVGMMSHGDAERSLTGGVQQFQVGE